jgi:hypothetical protein
MNNSSRKNEPIFKTPKCAAAGQTSRRSARASYPRTAPAGQAFRAFPARPAPPVLARPRGRPVTGTGTRGNTFFAKRTHLADAKTPASRTNVSPVRKIALPSQRASGPGVSRGCGEPAAPRLAARPPIPRALNQKPPVQNEPIFRRQKPRTKGGPRSLRGSNGLKPALPPCGADPRICSSRRKEALIKVFSKSEPSPVGCRVSSDSRISPARRALPKNFPCATGPDGTLCPHFRLIVGLLLRDSVSPRTAF